MNTLDLSQIDLQLPVMMATNKDQYRKPSTGMWEFVVENGNGAVQPGEEFESCQPRQPFLTSINDCEDIINIAADLSESFFVGDASGAADSFADSDK